MIFRLIDRALRGIESAAVASARFAWRLQRRLPLSLRFALGFVVLAATCCAAGWLLDGAYLRYLGFDAALVRYLDNAGHLAYGHRLACFCLVPAALSLLAAILSLIPRFRLSLILRLVWALASATLALAFVWIVRVPAIVNAADHKAFDSVSRNNLWTADLLVGMVVFLVPALIFFAILPAGRRLLANLKSGGADRRMRSSVIWSVALFMLVCFGPFLWNFFGWEEPYGIPAGGGEQQLEVVKVKKQKPKKPKKKLTVNPWSPYILERMDIEDVTTLQELDQETRDTYQAQNKQKSGGKGKGVGGWPSGMEGASVRFIRLKYRGGDWDQDMGKGADYNLLIKFREWTGLKIAKETEAREIQRLKYFPKKRSPPFVFLTGRGGMSVNDTEVKVLRDYCEKEGGMLFIDNGGGHFDSSVKQLLHRVFPDKPLVDIPNDDMIYQSPFAFPDGAPPFWHHAGYRAMGIRDEGRWMVYYHPGDINDAWKDGHSGASKEVADQAYKLGVNIIFYAFNQYCRRHFGQ